MAKAAYIGVGGVARKVKTPYTGISNVARKVKKGFIGVGGVARQFYSSEYTVSQSFRGGSGSTILFTAEQRARAYKIVFTNLIYQIHIGGMTGDYLDIPVPDKTYPLEGDTVISFRLNEYSYNSSVTYTHSTGNFQYNLYGEGNSGDTVTVVLYYE